MRQDDSFETSSKSTTTTLLEKDVETEQEQTHENAFKELNLFSSTVLAQAEKEAQEQEKPKSQTASKNEVLEALKQKIEEERIQNAMRLEEERKKLEEQQQQEEQVSQEEQTNQDVEEQVESLYNSSLSVEAQGEDEISESISSVTNDKAKGYKFRFRLLTGVFCCLVAILTGWIVSNSIQIASTSSQVATEVAKSNEYSANVLEYMRKIDSIERKTQGTPPNPEDGNLLPVEEVITITPQALDEPTEYEHESNWFDKICNWLRNLFGG